MSAKPKKKKFRWQQAAAMVFMMFVGAACGLAFVQYMETAMTDRPLEEQLFALAVLLVGIYIGFFLQTVLHEAGHLVFGLLSGYRFSSFRIGSFMWVKDGGRLRFRRMTIAGTGGQCLMEPPELVDGRIPVVLYNLGGSLMNVIASLLFLGLWALLRETLFGVFLLIAAIVGFATALLNGVPMRMGMLDNDGYNAFALSRDPAALRGFWVQLRANGQTVRGVRLKDMPEEWFALPADEDMGNSMVAALAVFACSRLIDAHRFEEAAALLDRYLDMDSAIVDLHRCLMTCDRMYCELIGENRPEKLDELLTKEQRKLMKSMRKSLTVLRTQYAYALLAEKDGGKAVEAKRQFDRVAETYPYPSDLQSERELMTIAEEKRAQPA